MSRSSIDVIGAHIDVFMLVDVVAIDCVDAKCRMYVKSVPYLQRSPSSRIQRLGTKLWSRHAT